MSEDSVDPDLLARFLALTPDRRRALLRRAPDSPPRLPRPALPARFAASAGQRSLWFLWRLAPRAATYAVPFAYELDGDLDVSALGSAITRLVDRHEALRTTVTDRSADDLVQVVHPPRPVAITAEVVPDRRAALTAALYASREPFDLRRGPLWRARLWRYAERRHLLSFVCHHIVVDERSNALIERDLAALYTAEVTGVPAVLPELPLQYVDYASRESDPTSDLDYWRARLVAAPTVDLPADRPRPSRATQAGATVDVRLPDLSRERLDRLAARLGVTPFVVALAVFVDLLVECTGQTDLVVGTPVSGRDHPGAENVVGYFLDTLALRVDAAGCGFAELVARVRRAFAEGLAHRGAAFPDVVRALGVPSSTARHPLFDVMFTLVDAREEVEPWAGLTVGPLPVPAAGAQFDLTAALVRDVGGLTLGLRYASDLFDEARVRGWGVRYGEILVSRAALYGIN